MKTPLLSAGVAHPMPIDLKTALTASKKSVAVWEDITPLARNEYICWVENAQQIETRGRRIRRTVEQLEAGHRRPCCWAGCIHRKKL